MDEINEQTENMKQIQDALSAPIGSSVEFDEVTKRSVFNHKEESTFEQILKLFIETKQNDINIFFYVKDELEAELEDLEEAELEEQLLQKPTISQAPIKVPPMNIPSRQPSSLQSKSQSHHRNEEEEELAALQAEMAL